MVETIVTPHTCQQASIVALQATPIQSHVVWADSVSGSLLWQFSTFRVAVWRGRSELMAFWSYPVFTQTRRRHMTLQRLQEQPAFVIMTPIYNK